MTMRQLGLFLGTSCHPKVEEGSERVLKEVGLLIECLIYQRGCFKLNYLSLVNLE